MKSYKTLFQRTVKLLAIVLVIALLSTGIAKAQSVARAGLLEEMEIRPGVRVEIPINVENVVDLYGIDIELKFDPAFWEFEDADPHREGIQPALGTFLDPGMTLYNRILPKEGLVQLVLSQINPSEAKSGSGTILVLYARALKTGTTKIEVQKVELATRDGLGIEVEGVDGEIVIKTQAPVVTATSIPVIDPTEIITIPTYIPPTQTFTPVPTSTPIPNSTPVPTATKVTTSEPAISETSSPNTGSVTAPGEEETASPAPETAVETSEVDPTVTAEVSSAVIEDDTVQPTQIPVTIDETELSKAQEGGNGIWFIVVILAAAAILAVSFLVKNKRKN